MNKDRYNIILNIKNGSSNRLRESYFFKNYIDVYNDIMEYTKKIEVPFKQRIWHWVNCKPYYILCKCGNRVSFNMNWEDGYKEYCSNKCSSNSTDVREKTKKTNFDKYGTEFYSKTSEYSDKVKKTSIERYGVDNYSKTNEYKEKNKKTNLNKYGFEFPNKSDYIKKKSIETNLNKYGFEYYFQTDEFKKKFKEKMIDKYGADSYFKSEKNRQNFNISNNENYIKYNNDSTHIFMCDCGKDHFFNISTDNYYGRLFNNNKLCTECNPISDLSSLKEKILYEFVKDNYNGDIIKSYRNIYEIDIYLPELKIGIEFNGIYWHSDKFKDKYYHLNKINYFKNKGIHIIYIWEDDWIYKNNIIKSQILNLLGKSDRIWARECIIKEVNDYNIVKDFLNNNHIQGYVTSSLKIGLYYKDELISLMTFDKFEGRIKMNDNEWNLNRFCTIQNKVVVGGASKILKYFINKYNPLRIISYADSSWSDGNLYYKLGFSKINELKPDYKYILNNKRIHKSRFKKSITKIKESEYVIQNNLLKIWDSGKLKFELILKKD